MDIEKAIQFLIEQQAEQQARFEARFAKHEEEFDRDMAELRRHQKETERLINAFAQVGAAQIDLHRGRLDSLERRMEVDEQRFQAFLNRFDAFLKGQQGNGHAG